jgi:hypothetical protein
VQSTTETPEFFYEYGMQRGLRRSRALPAVRNHAPLLISDGAHRQRPGVGSGAVISKSKRFSRGHRSVVRLVWMIIITRRPRTHQCGQSLFEIDLDFIFIYI